MKKLTMILAGIMMFAVAGNVAASDSHDAKGKQHASHQKPVSTVSAGLSLYDANGQNLGSLLYEDTVVTRFASGYKILQFQNDGRIWGGVLHYPTPDCSGAAYVESGGGTSYQLVIRVGDSLYEGKNGALTEISTCSTKDDTGTCTLTELCNTSYRPVVIEMVEMTDVFPFNYPVAYPLTIN